MFKNTLNTFANVLPSLSFETVLNATHSALPVARVGCYAAAAFLAGRKIFQGTASATCKVANIAAKRLVMSQIKQVLRPPALQRTLYLSINSRKYLGLIQFNISNSWGSIFTHARPNKTNLFI